MRTALWHKVNCNWPKLLDLLGVVYDRPVLPATAVCPFCTRDLTIVADPIYFEPWCSCESGCLLGSIFELPRKIWGISTEGTLRGCWKHQVVEFDSDEDLADEAAKIDRTREHRALASTVWQHPENFADLGNLVEKHVSSNLNFAQQGYTQTHWNHGPGQIIGVTDLPWLQLYTTGRRSLYKTGLTAIQRPHLCFPVWDLPDRIRGFVVMRDISQGGWLQNYINAHPHAINRHTADSTPTTRVRRADGLCMFPTITKSPPHKLFGDLIFACDDIITAASLQIRNHLSTFQLLPLVAWFQPHKEILPRVWSGLAGRPIYWWVREFDAAILSAARECNARIYVSPNEETRNRLLCESPEYVLQQVIKQSLSWQDAIEKWMRALDFETTVRKIRTLSLTGKAASSLSSRITDRRVKQRLTAQTRAEHRERVVVVNVDYTDRQLFARPSGWHLAVETEQFTEQLTNFTLTIDHLADAPGRGDYFSGRVEFQDQTYPIVGPWNPPEGRAAWLSSRFAEIGLTNASYLKPIPEDPFLIGKRFGNPDHTELPVWAGWNPDRNCFAFADFCVYVGGEVWNYPLPWSAIDPSFPAQIGGYRETTPGDLPDCRLFDKLVVALITAIVAPALGLPAPAVGMAPELFRVAQEFARLFDLRPRTTLTAPLHRWPRLIDATETHHPITAASLADPAGDFFLIKPSQEQASDWIQITPSGPIPGKLPNTPGILAGYLQQLCERNLLLPEDSNLTLISRIGLDYRRWIESIRGEHRDEASAEELGESPTKD